MNRSFNSDAHRTKQYAELDWKLIQYSITFVSYVLVVVVFKKFGKSSVFAFIVRGVGFPQLCSKAT